MFTACGSLQATPNVAMTLQTVGRVAHNAHYGEGDDSVYIRLLVGQTGDGKPAPDHLHVDVARRAAFSPPTNIPMDSTSPQALLEILGKFIGARVKVKSQARYEIPWNQIPPNGFVGMSRVRVELPELRVHQNVGTYIIAGRPGSANLSWRTVGATDNVQVSIEAWMNPTIDQAYLSGLFNVPNGIWHQWVLGQTMGG
jgi:hypothetical protein